MTTALAKHAKEPSTLGARREHAAKLVAEGATRPQVQLALRDKFGKGIGTEWLNEAYRAKKRHVERARPRRRYAPREPKLPADPRIACAFMAAGIPFSFDGKALRLPLPEVER